MIVQECAYEPPHSHEFPDDWEFGGANGEDPRSDPRWSPTTYVYLDEKLEEVWRTCVPLCDNEALDRFTQHASLGAKYIQVRRPGERDFTPLPWQYDAVSDLVSSL